MDRTIELAEVLGNLGIEIKRTHQDEINGRCPVHHLSKGRESSRFSWYINSETGLWYCFSCGARGNLSMLVSQLTADPSALWDIQKHLITSGLHRITSDEQEARITYEPIDWSEYSKFDMLPDVLLVRRGLERSISNRFGVRWDVKNKAMVLPIVSPVGELWGWQLKKTGWVRNHPIGVHKGDTLFGIERAYAPTGILLESPLDVVRFHSVYEGSDYSAVASFGANVSDKQISVLASRFDRLIIAMDNDPAGKLETKRLRKALPSFRKGLRFWSYDGVSCKDLGDMSDYQIIRGLTQVTSVHV